MELRIEIKCDSLEELSEITRMLTPIHEKHDMIVEPQLKDSAEVQDGTDTNVGDVQEQPIEAEEEAQEESQQGKTSSPIAESNGYKHGKYSDDEIDYILDNEHKTDREIADHLNRTFMSVYQKRIALGCKHKGSTKLVTPKKDSEKFEVPLKRGKWSNYDIEFVKANREMPIEDISKHIHRSKDSIRKQLEKMEEPVVYEKETTEPTAELTKEQEMLEEIKEIRFTDDELSIMLPQDAMRARMLNRGLGTYTPFDFCERFQQRMPQFVGLEKEEKTNLAYKLATPFINDLVRKYKNAG